MQTGPDVPAPNGPFGLLTGSSAAYDAAGDVGMVRRVAVLCWLLWSALSLSMLAGWPPGHRLGPVGWPAALAGPVLGIGAAAWTLRRGKLSQWTALGVSVVMIAASAMAGWLTGGPSPRLILLPLVFIGASQAPRRVLAVLPVAAFAQLPALLAGSDAQHAIAEAVLNLILWVSVTLLAVMWTAGVRWQRLQLRREREAAHELALQDPVTGLGNRRRLMADLEAVVAEGAPAVLALFDLNGFKGYNDSFGHSAGDVLLARLGARLMTLAGDAMSAYRMGGDEFCLLAVGSRPTEEILNLGRRALSEQGHGFRVSAAGGAAVLPDDTGDVAAALRLADGRMYASKHDARGSSGRDGVEMLLAVLEERYPSLSEHSESVARLAVEIGRRLGVAERAEAHLRRAAQLHDIGKLAIPDAILEKPGPLDDDEWEFIRRHTIVGQRIVSSAPQLMPVGEIIRSSHERWDGQGYPEGLQGEQIALEARIIAACDAYDAMRSTRAYRASLERSDALAELRRGAGTQFDPEVVAALIDAVENPALVGAT